MIASVRQFLRTLVGKLPRMLATLLVVVLVGAMAPPAQPLLAQDDTIYLPTVRAPSGLPHFKISSPEAGSMVSGTTYFAVNVLTAGSVSSVEFRAGDESLGLDDQVGDGYRVVLDASTFADGPLQLTAIATGPNGSASQTITVDIVSQPPSTAQATTQGAVLATEIGSVITVKPGAVPPGTEISVEERTQQQVTNDTNIDWDGLGVTFLGAQNVNSAAPIAQPLGVSSAGFGNRVQPEQAVVNYQLLPDADGDGVSEIVVVNGASVAPNNDVISDPVDGIGLGNVRKLGQNQVTAAVRLQDGLSGPPGTTFELEVTGFNVASALGNVAIFRQGATEVRVPIVIQLDQDNPLGQIAYLLLPALPPGPATVTLRNESTGDEMAPFDVTIEAAPPLSGPAAEIIDNTLADAIAGLNQVLTLSEGELGTTEPAVTQAISATTELRDELAAIADDPTPQQQEALDQLASMFENSAISSMLEAGLAIQAQAIQGLCDNQGQIGLITAGTGAMGAALMAIGALATGGLLPAVLIIGGAAIVGGSAGAAVGTGIACWDDGNPPPACSPAPSGSGNGTTGMGAAPPPGGPGCGNVGGGSVGGGGAGGGLLQAAAADGVNQSRYIVKIFPQAGGPALTPFTGATDPGGYFFIPLIPEGEPFSAVATERLTGASVTVSGVGPPLGGYVYLYFDFSDAAANRFDISIGDVISDGVPAEGAGNIEVPSGRDIYLFNGVAGQQVYFDVQAHEQAISLLDWTLFDPGGEEIFSSCLGCTEAGVQTLPKTGLYTLIAGDDSTSATGTYRVQLWNVPPPDSFSIDIDDPISPTVPGPGAGNIESPGVKDVYTFEATPGQQVYFDVLDRDSDISLVSYRVVDSDGTQIFDTCLGCSEAGVRTLSKGGTYTLTVGEDTDDGVGQYALRLWNVPPANLFNISIGDQIGPNMPGAGAGNIESPGVKDIYVFDATPGQQVYFDVLDRDSDISLVSYRLVDNDGTQIFDACLGCTEVGVRTLAKGGTYTLTVGEDTDDGVGEYTLQLSNVPAPHSFDISIGDTISDGVPAEGAGNIELPGAGDIYTFDAAPNTTVNFTIAPLPGANGLGQVPWRLEDSAGEELFDTCINCTDPGDITLALGGVYTITVQGVNDGGTGPYTFTLATP